MVMFVLKMSDGRIYDLKREMFGWVLTDIKLHTSYKVQYPISDVAVGSKFPIVMAGAFGQIKHRLLKVEAILRVFL